MTSLDCYNGDWQLDQVQAEYLKEWHDDFVKWVSGAMAVICALYSHPQATEKDRIALEHCRAILSGPDAMAVEESLTAGIVTQAVLDKIEMLNKELVDTAVDHIQTSLIEKELLKQLMHLKFHQDKTAQIIQLRALGIGGAVGEGENGIYVL